MNFHLFMKRTVLVPIAAVEDLDAAIDVVDTAVGTASLMLMDQDADFCIAPSNRENDSAIEVDEKWLDSYTIFERDF